MKLTGVMIGTENSQKLGEFYAKIFGSAVYQEDDWYGFDVAGGSLMIGPHSEVSGKNPNPPRIMITIADNAVEETYKKFVDMGAEPIAEPYQPDSTNSPNVWLATVSDPDGNYLQISTPWEDA